MIKKISQKDLHKFFKGKKVVITGHTGFKGSWLSLALKNFGAQVYGYSLKKNTYPKLIGIEKSRSRAESLCNEAIQSLKSLPYNTEKLVELSKFIVERKN